MGMAGGSATFMANSLSGKDIDDTHSEAIRHGVPGVVTLNAGAP